MNINRLYIVILEGVCPLDVDICLFDHYEIINGDTFVGLTTRVNELDGAIPMCNNILILRLLDSIKLSLPIFLTEGVYEFCGVKKSKDEIIDLFLDEDLDEVRRYYLENMLYYLETQKDKPILKYKLWVKHYDDFIHEYGSDIISSKVIKDNFDFSESYVEIESCLTEAELRRKVGVLEQLIVENRKM